MLDAPLHSGVVKVTHNGRLVPATGRVGSHLAQVEVLHPDCFPQPQVLLHQTAVLLPYLPVRPTTSPAAIGTTSIGFAAATVGPTAGRHGGEWTKIILSVMFAVACCDATVLIRM